MAYYEDLSEYRFLEGEFYRPGTKNVGWLAIGHDFDSEEPSDEILQRLWEFCKIAVAQTRGIHECEFCGCNSYFVERNGETLLLGSSEIRVLSKRGEIYAAPNLIYHYMLSHNYRPPDEFIRSLKEGIEPSSQEYFNRLGELSLAWSKTSSPAERPRRFRAVRNPITGVVERQEV